MSSSYVTRQGDTLDLICYAYYGTERKGVVEAVLEANTGLADYGPILPMGITITLPDISTPVTTETTITLWS